MRFRLVNYHTFPTDWDDGAAFSATLCGGGRVLGRVSYDGTGGPFRYVGVPDDVLAELTALGERLYRKLCAEHAWAYNADTERSSVADVAIDHLIQELAA